MDSVQNKNQIKQQNAAIGILGGTFDPIHLGHTEPAKDVAIALGLSEIVLLPANIPPHKAQPQANSTQRLTMVQLAAKTASTKQVNFRCDPRELARNHKSYTVETLKTFKRDYPNQTLYFIIGMDSLLSFTQWHQYKEILSLCNLVVNTRPNHCISTINSATKILLDQHQIDTIIDFKKQPYGAIIFSSAFNSGLSSSFKTCLNKDYDISSTQIRTWLKQQNALPQQHQLTNSLPVSPLVLDFINKNQLYR